MSAMLRLGLALLLVVVAYAYLAGVGSGDFGLPQAVSLGGEDEFEQRIEPPSEGDMRLMDAQREVVEELAMRLLGSPLHGGSKDDLGVIQRILDKRVLKPDQTYELQALGVVFGDVIAEQLGLDWVVVEDEYGRSRALRYEETRNLVFPTTMISRRVEAELRFTVLELYETAEEALAEFRASAPRPGT